MFGRVRNEYSSAHSSSSAAPPKEVSIGRGLKDFLKNSPLSEIESPLSGICFRGGQCQADSPTVRNVSHWANISVSRLPMDTKKVLLPADYGNLENNI